MTLVPALERTQVEVKGEGSAVEQGSSPATAVSGQLAKEMPSRPATVADALPLVPGVVREPGGALRISDSPENRSALIVNSADVTDPATGQFGITVPMDSVQTVNVYQTAFLAEYGRFTAGLVSVETKRGGDKWKWELNDPVPRVSHPQLAPARAQDGHAAAQFRRPHPARQTLHGRGLRIRNPEDRGLHAAVSAQSEDWWKG